MTYLPREREDIVNGEDMFILSHKYVPVNPIQPGGWRLQQQHRQRLEVFAYL